MPLTPQEAEKLKRLIDQLTDGDTDGRAADSLNPDLAADGRAHKRPNDPENGN